MNNGFAGALAVKLRARKGWNIRTSPAGAKYDGYLDGVVTLSYDAADLVPIDDLRRITGRTIMIEVDCDEEPEIVIWSTYTGCHDARYPLSAPNSIKLVVEEIPKIQQTIEAYIQAVWKSTN